MIKISMATSSQSYRSLLVSVPRQENVLKDNVRSVIQDLLFSFGPLNLGQNLSLGTGDDEDVDTISRNDLQLEFKMPRYITRVNSRFAQFLSFEVLMLFPHQKDG